jgi:plasmid stabilization system protein ParE
MRIKLEKGAERDLEEGLRWYRERSDQAADNFVTALSDTLDRILKDPTRYRSIAENLRTIKMGDYPFNLIYRITPHFIKVYAVAHEKRRPGYWRRRVK